MNDIIDLARSNDCTRLWWDIGHYVAPDPSVTAVTPPINGSLSPTQLGLNHPVLACLLCPIEAVDEYDDDPTEYALHHLLLRC